MKRGKGKKSARGALCSLVIDKKGGSRLLASLESRPSKKGAQRTRARRTKKGGKLLGDVVKKSEGSCR